MMKGDVGEKLKGCWKLKYHKDSYYLGGVLFIFGLDSNALRSYSFYFGTFSPFSLFICMFPRYSLTSYCYNGSFFLLKFPFSSILFCSYEGFAFCLSACLYAFTFFLLWIYSFICFKIYFLRLFWTGSSYCWGDKEPKFGRLWFYAIGTEGELKAWFGEVFCFANVGFRSLLKTPINWASFEFPCIFSAFNAGSILGFGELKTSCLILACWLALRLIMLTWIY